jgi:hypothetical protein
VELQVGGRQIRQQNGIRAKFVYGILIAEHCFEILSSSEKVICLKVKYKVSVALGAALRTLTLSLILSDSLCISASCFARLSALFKSFSRLGSVSRKRFNIWSRVSGAIGGCRATKSEKKFQVKLDVVTCTRWTMPWIRKLQIERSR